MTEVDSDIDSIVYLPITCKQTLQNCQQLQPTNNLSTLFIASYPKSGTTWMQAIVYILINGKEPSDHISNYSPFYEIDKTWNNNFIQSNYVENHNKIGWRIFNTHLRWKLMPRGDTYKYIYLYRNGKDVCTSFYYHLSNQADSGGYEGTLTDFMNQWTSNLIPFGGWISHLRSWIAASKSNNEILLVSYEDLKTNLVETLYRIVNHLDIQKGNEKEYIESLLPLMTFTRMREVKEQYQPISVSWKEGYEFIRKGQCNDHVNIFTKEHYEIYDSMVKNSDINESEEIILKSI